MNPRSLKDDSGGRVVLRCDIRDTGIGISADSQALLFRPFSQADTSMTRRFGGTGLGLSISRRLVELMDGEIGVDSEEGKGAVFWFTAAFARQQEGADEAEPLPSADLSGCRVLVVDDNATNRHLLSCLLGSWGCDAVEVENGVAALAYLRQAAAGGNPFEIALLDMNMPEMDGETLGGLIRNDAMLAATRCVMLTSAAMRGDAERLRQAGFAAYLTKPLKEAHIRRCLAALRHDAAASTPAANVLITRHTLEESDRRVLRILLVEDNPVNQKVACAMLAKHQCRVDVSGDGRQALAALTREPYDLVLMDCQMPVMDGFEATRRIRAGDSAAIDPRIPIIAMTANAMQGDRERCLEAGMDDYLAKPISEQQLVAIIAGRFGTDAVAELPAAQIGAAGTAPACAAFDPDDMLKRFAGDQGIAVVMIEGLLVDLPLALVALEHALASGSAADALRAAHTIKGLAAGGGAAALRNAAHHIEQFCQDGLVDEAVRYLPDLRRCLDRVIPAWQDYLAPPARPSGATLASGVNA